MPIFFSDSIDIYYEIHGSGPPLLLIAGLASDSHSWLTILPELSRYCMLIVPDNRGVGRSTQTGINISIENMADDCMALLDHLGITSAHILGHSMGGLVAVDCAARYPERVSTLLLAATSTSISERTSSLFRNWSDMLESGLPKDSWLMSILPWLLTSSFFEDRQQVEAAVQSSIDYPYQQEASAFRNQVEALAAYDCKEIIGRIKVKTLIMHGRNDLLFPAEESCRSLEALPDVEMRIIERAAHSIHLEQPEEFIKNILHFLDIR